MLIDKLKQLQTEGQPQTLDELFQSSKEGMLLDKVKNAVNMLLPQMKENMKNELRAEMANEIKQQVSEIKVKDGRDADENKIIGKIIPMIPIPKDGKNGKDGKDAIINKDELIAELAKRIPRQRGGGGSTLRVDNLSSQANGVTRSFTTTYKIGSAHLLFYSSFPTFFLPTTDYSISGTAITLNASIDPPVAGQSLAIFYESAD